MRLRQIGGVPASLAAAAAAVAMAACEGDVERFRPDDSTPPTVAIAQPAEGGIVNTRTPGFVVEISDAGVGYHCPTLNATIDGSDVGAAFRNVCSEGQAEIRVPPGKILPPLDPGSHTLVFRISDRAGNEATATRRFTVDVGTPPPPEPA